MESGKGFENETVGIGSSTASMSTYLLLGKLVAFIVAAISLVVVARILGPSGYGVYVVAIAVAGVAGAVGNFGIGTALTKFISEYKSKKNAKMINEVLSNGMAILVVVGTIFTVATFLLSGIAAEYALHGVQYTYILQTASLIILVSILSGAIYSSLIGFGYGKYSALYSIFEILVQGGLSISLALLGFGPISPVIGIIFGQLTGFIFCLYVIYIIKGNKLVMPSIAGMRKLFNFSAPIALSNFFSSVVSDFSVIFLGLFVASAVVGNFGIAARTNYLGDIVVGSIGLAILPGFTRLFAGKKKKSEIGRFYNKALYVSLVVVSPFMFFLIFFAKPVSYLAFSSAYQFAPLYIAVAAAGIIISIFGSYSSTVLISDNRTKDVMKYRIYIFGIQLVMMLLLVYLFKGIGLAVLIFLIGPVLQCIFYTRRISSLYKIKTEYKRVFMVLISNILSFSAVYVLLSFLGNNYLLLVPLGILGVLILYPIVLGVTRSLEREDSKMMKELSTNMPVVGKLLCIVLSYAEAFMP